MRTSQLYYCLGHPGTWSLIVIYSLSKLHIARVDDELERYQEEEGSIIPTEQQNTSLVCHSTLNVCPLAVLPSNNKEEELIQVREKFTRGYGQCRIFLAGFRIAKLGRD